MLMKKNKDFSLPPSKPVVYPSGTFVETELGFFYIKDSSRRLRITSKRVLDSWSPHRVVKTTEAAVKNYRVSSKMRFRNGSLIHNIADGRIYLIVDGKRCHMTSPDAFERIGAEENRRYVMSVSLEEVNLHTLGEDIS